MRCVGAALVLRTSAMIPVSSPPPCWRLLGRREAGQKNSVRWHELWEEYADGWLNRIRDPRRHGDDVLRTFLDKHAHESRTPGAMSRL